MSRRLLLFSIVWMIPAKFYAQSAFESCEGQALEIAVDLPLGIDVDSAQWFLNSNPIGPLQLNPTTADFYDSSLGADESGVYEFIIWYTDAESQSQDSLLGSWEVTVWTSLSFNPTAVTFDLCAIGNTELELGTISGGSGSFDWSWTALGPNDTLAIELPNSLTQIFGPDADSSQYALTLIDLEGCGSISTTPWTFQTQDTLGITVGVINGNGASGLWCHGQPIGLSATPGYALYHWIWVDASGTLEAVTAAPSWTTPDLTSNATISVQAISLAGCSTGTDAMNFGVLAPIEAPVTASLTAICNGQSALITLAQEASPVGLDWNYAWINSDGLVLGNGQTLQVNNLTGDLHFSVVATSLEGCGTISSGVTVQPVFDALAPPVITLSNPAFPDTACYGSSDFELNIAEEAAPGMSFSYQWHVNGLPVAETDGGTLVPFELAILTEDVVVFVTATSLNGCGQTTSAPFIQPVFPELQAPVIAPSVEFSADTLCFGTSGFTLLQSSPAAANMAFSYSWFVDGIEIFSSDEANLELPALEASATFELEVTSLNGCGSRVSNAWYQPVFGPIASPEVGFESYDPTDTLCFGADGPLIVQEVPPLSGMAFQYVWLSQTASTPPSPYSSTGTMLLDVASLTETTSFALEATSVNGCGTYVSNYVHVPVFPLPQAPVITFSQESPTLPICFGGQAPDLELATPPAVGMAFDWQWLGGAGSPIIGEIGTILPGTELQVTSGFSLLATSVNGCGSWTSNEVLIEVWPALAPGSSSAVEDIICFGSSATLNSVPATGGNGEFSVQWLAGTVGNQLSPLPGSSSSPWTTPDLEVSTWFAPLFTSSYGCGQIAGEPTFIEVLPEVSAGFLSAPDSICFNTTPQTLTVTNASGADGLFSAVWLEGNGESWTQVQEGSNAYGPGNLTETTVFRCDFISDFGCGTFPSNEVEIYVFEEVQAGFIMDFDSPICFGFDGNLEATAEISGENIAYQWEVSSNGIGWAPISGETELDLVLAEQTQNGFYRLRYISEDGCPSDVTANAELIVYPALQAPIISSFGNDSTFCFGSTGPTFIATSPPAGGNGMFGSSWQFSPNGLTWNNTASSTVYTPNAVTQSGQYRLNSNSAAGCGTVSSNSINVSVFPAITPSTIVGAQTLCFMEAGTDLVGNVTTGADGNFTYQWVSTTGGPFTPLMGENNISMAINGLSATTTFSLQATSNYGCGVVESNSVEVFVWDELIPGSLMPAADTACFGWDLVIEATPVTSGQNISTQWHIGSSSASLTASPDQAVDLNWTMEALESSLFYAISYTSNNGCGTVWSDTAHITVLPAVVHPVIELETAGADSICYNTLPSLFLQAAPSTGANEDFNYLWEMQMEGSSSWTSIDGAPSDWLLLPEQTTSFSVRQDANDVLCGSFYSNEIQVHVFAPFVPAILEGEQLICHGTAPEIISAIGPTGGGDDYLFEWATVTSTDTLLIPGETNDSLETTELFETTAYVLESTSSFGCGTGWSNALVIQVADSLIAGTFEVDPIGELCSGDAVSGNGLDAMGGIGSNEWTWWIGDGNSWQIAGIDLDLGPIELSQTVQLALTFGNECGTVSSDTLTIIVNPLPPLESIEGDLNPCVGSVANYLSIGNYNPAIDYSWASNSSSVEITSGETGPAILYNHDASNDPLQFQVTLEYNATGCISDSTFIIFPSMTESPPLGYVEKKPGIDLLVCSDSSDCAQYRWGILNLQTNDISWIPGETDQYLYYEGLNAELGVFCVEVIYDCGDGVISCPTIMYWNYSPFLDIDEANERLITVYPNPFSSSISISGVRATAWYLFDKSGRLISQGGQTGTSWNLPVELERGAYVLAIQTEFGYIRKVVLRE